MKVSQYIIKENKSLNDLIYKMVLEGDTTEIKHPGEFINIQLPSFYLRRPISVCDYDDHSITIIYKVVGNGTQYLSKLDVNTTLDVMTGLGNGYDISISGSTPLLIGGGVGVPPLYKLAKELIKENKQVTVILGFNTKSEIFYQDEFEALGCKVIVTTVDGSVGVKGFVTDALPSDYSYIYTCGPLPMLKAIYNATEVSGQYSFEERMGCGFGACMGCSTKTKDGYKRVCKDGPIFYKEEIVWEK